MQKSSNKPRLDNEVYIGLGSNLNQPQEQLNKALVAITNLPDSQLVKQSSFYQSAPMGPQNQSDFINAVILINTRLTAFNLLDALQQIEQSQGRVRKQERWGARTLDLDILLYNNEIIETTTLVVPHYDMKQRSFVLTPLLEIAPKLILPDGAKLIELESRLDKQGLKRL